jgi:hypothetical protein
VEQIAREGARRALQNAIEDEVAEYVEAHKLTSMNRITAWWCVTVTSRRGRFSAASARSR